MLIAVVVVFTLAAGAQPAPADSSSTAPGDSSGTEQSSHPAASTGEGFPRLNLYLPEGEFDIRVRRMIRNVLFEGQVNYNFINGDISTFLRYKYYASSYTYRIGVFDSIEFRSVDAGTKDFNRTRGGLVLFEIPVDARNRWEALLESDSLTFGDVTNPDNKRDNLYVKLGYQFGTPFDERLNSIVGETRGRLTPVLTSYRQLEPRRLSLAVAVTQGVDAIVGDYQYTKAEAEGLERFDLPRSTFLVTRVHAGTFVEKGRRADYAGPLEYAKYTIPAYEYFRIGGRDALKGLSDSALGSDEIHWSNELFTPVLRNRKFRTWQIHWSDLYGIGYLGTGNLGFGSKTFTRVGDWVADAGLGLEAAGRWRDYSGYLTVVYAQTVIAPSSLHNSEIRVSLRTVH